MEVLKTLVVFLLVIGTFAEDTKRKGKCGSKPVNRERYNAAKEKYQRKPVPQHDNGDHRYNIQSDYYPQSNNYYSSDTQTPYETGTPYSEGGDGQDYPSYESGTSYATTSQLNISPNGEVYRGRSLKYNGAKKNFHEDETKELNHVHRILNDEYDDDEKQRTVRSTSTLTGPSASSLNAASAGNSANAGNSLQATATGLLVEVQNHGASSASGEGASSASGSTTITQNGHRNGSSDETPEALSATLGALGASLQSQGSSHAAGQGSVSASGSTTNTVTSSNTFKSMEKRIGKK